MAVVSSGSFTLIDVNDGFNARLTLDAAIVPTDPDGSKGNYSAAQTTLSVWIGTNDDTQNWQVSAAPSALLTGQLVGNTYTVTDLGTDVGYVDLTATRPGYPAATARFTISKAKQGDRGLVINAAQSASGFTFTDGVASPADQVIAVSVIRSSATLDGVATFYASNGAILETDKDKISILHHALGYPHEGRGDTCYVKLSDFGDADQMYVTAVIGPLTAVAHIVRLDFSTAAAGATRNVFKGAWEAGQAYSVGDSVVYEGAGWQVTVAHVSTTGNRPPSFPTTSNANWAQAAAKGDRGTIVTAYAIAGSTWSDNDANTAILLAGGVEKQKGDVVTLHRNAVGFSQTRVWTGTFWNPLAAFYGGDVLVDGTITAGKLGANSVTTNNLVAGAVTAAEIASDAITTSKLLVKGSGASLNADPTFEDEALWDAIVPNAYQLVASSTAYSGNKVLRATGYQAKYPTAAGRFPINPNKVYLLELVARKVTGSSIIYGIITFYTASGAAIAATTTWTSRNGTNHYFPSGVLPATSWTRYATKMGAGQTGFVIPSNAAYFGLSGLWNYTGPGTDVVEIGLFRVADAVDGELIVDGSITANHLTAGSVTAGKIAAGAIVANDIAASTITGAKIAGQTITGANIVTDTITATQLAANAVTATQLAAGAVTAGKIAAGTIVANDIAAATITGAKIASNTITATQIAATTITAAELAANSVIAGKIAAGAVSATEIAAGAIIAGKIGAGAIVANDISTGAITAIKLSTGELITLSAQIKDAIITDAKIANLSAAKLTAGTALAGTITVSGTALSTIQTQANDPAARINAATTKINPGQILISGATTLSNWIKGGDVTKIDGGAISANTITANKLEIGSRNITLTGVQFEANAPANNKVSWTVGTVNYINDAGTITSKAITASNATWTSGILYIYWVKDATTISTTTSQATAFGANNVVLATYEGGVKLDVDFGRTIIDGSTIKSGSITTDQLEANVLSADNIAAGTMSVARLVVDEVLAIDAINSGFAMGKNNPLSLADDGVYMGRTNDGGSVGFGFAVSYNNGSTTESIQATSQTGLKINNAKFFRDLAPVPVTTMVTTSTVITLPAGSELLTLSMVGGGGGGSSGDQSYDGFSGGATTVQLRNGITVVKTWTAAGGAAGTELYAKPGGGYYGYGEKGGSTVWGVGGDGGKLGSFTGDYGRNGSGYGSGGGGGGGCSGSGRGGEAGKAGQFISISEYDISNLTTPNLVITVGALGNGAPGGGPNNGGIGGKGAPGRVDYYVASTQAFRADVIPLEPTAKGTMLCQGPFPDLGAGYWVLCRTASGNMDIGDIEINTSGQTIRLHETQAASFVSSKTPVVINTPYPGKTLSYQFFKMGS